MGLAESAAILLGIGIVSSRFKAGVGLGELGTGISTLVAAPLTGTGTGLSSFAGGVRDLAQTFGDLGRGLGELFANIPKLPPAREGPPRHGTTNGNGNGNGGPPIYQLLAPASNLIPDSGGSSNTLLTGGGGAVTQPVIIGPVYRPPPVTRPGGIVGILPGYTPPPIDLQPDIMIRPITMYDRNRPIMM